MQNCTSLLLFIYCSIFLCTVDFVLMGPPVKPVSYVISPLCQEQTYDNVITILCLIGFAA